MSRTYLRGDLYCADLGHGIGSEQKGTRPVVIIQNNVGNKHSPTVIIAAITSKANIKAKLPTHYYLDAGNGLFLTCDGMPKVGLNYNGMLKNLVKKYNKHHKEQLPNITPHSLRHTFCTRMANAGMNPKALQYIMGHANITMTLDYYTHVDACSVKAEMERLAA